MDEPLYPKTGYFGLSIETMTWNKGTMVYIAPEIWENREYKYQESIKV